MTLAVLNVTNGAVIDASGTQYVIAAEGAELVAGYVVAAQNAAAAAEAAASAALAAAGIGEYADTAAGLAGTSVGETFWVNQGDGTGIIYRHDAGPVATALRPFIIDPTDSGAAGLIGATGGSIQDALDALSDGQFLPAIGQFGALTPAATAAATLAAAFAGVGPGGLLASLEEASVGTAPVTNPGVDIVGEKGIYWDDGVSGGRRLINRPGRDELTWGHENLVRWLEGLRTFATLKVALVGDSNTEGFAGAIIATYLDSLPNVSVSNFGVSGKNIEQWRTGTDVFASNGKALSDVITYDPDLIVMCWGTNDPLVGRDAEDFGVSLNAALTTLRASLDINTCSIALLTPNAMSISGRDELYSLQLRPIIRAAAERFTCGFFDKNGLFPNSVVDLAAGAMQNKFWDSARVHTDVLGRNLIATKVAEWLVPRELWARTWENIPAKATADLSSTYPPGVSIARMTDGALNGFVVTFVALNSGSTIFAMQFNFGFGGVDARFASRVALSGVWSAWRFVGYDALAVVGTLAAGYSLAGGAASLNTQRDGNLVSLSGRLTRAAGQVVSSTVLAVIPGATHRPIFNLQDVIATVTNAGGAVERLRCDVTTAGSIVNREASVMSDATTISFNVTYRGA